MWSPLVDAAGIAAQPNRTRGMLALDTGDVDGAEASLREALSHFEKLQFTADVAAVALDLSGLVVRHNSKRLISTYWACTLFSKVPRSRS